MHDTRNGSRYGVIKPSESRGDSNRAWAHSPGQIGAYVPFRPTRLDLVVIHMTEHHNGMLARRPPEQLALPLAYPQADRPVISGIGGPLKVKSSERNFARSRRSVTRTLGTSYTPDEFPRLGEEHGGAIWRRIIDQGVRFGLLNPQLGSEMGRLAFHGQITVVEAEAGSMVAEIYARYERSLGLRRSAARPSFTMNFDGPDFTEETEIDVLRARRARRHYDKLQKLIPSAKARAILEQLCVDDQPIGPIDLMDARILLRRLAVAFGILRRNKPLRESRA